MCITVILFETTSSCQTNTIRIDFGQPGLEHRRVLPHPVNLLVKIRHLLQKAFIFFTFFFFFFSFLEMENLNHRLWFLKSLRFN